MRLTSTTALLACERCGAQQEVDLAVRYTPRHTVIEMRPAVPFVAAHLAPVFLDPLPPA